MAKPQKGPRSPSDRARHPLVVVGNAIFTLLLLLGVGGAGLFLYGNHVLEEPGPLIEEKSVVIPRGSTIADIADKLEAEGVIRSADVFSIGQKLTKRDAKFQAGEYLFKPGQSVESVLDTLASGKVVQHQITIPEGLTSQQIVQRLADNDLLAGEGHVPPEGTLLPESYRVSRGMQRDELLKRMAEAQDKLVKELWAKRAKDLPLKSPREMIILASIVEKETGRADERPKVAAVFINRLNKKMRLQSDPTIIYGIVGGKGTLGRGITKADIATPTAYNTYAIDGLPPGPIANPGRDALAAVANPPKTQDLFFVADGTGGHAFAATLADHNRNVTRWRAIEAGSESATVKPGAAAN